MVFLVDLCIVLSLKRNKGKLNIEHADKGWEECLELQRGQVVYGKMK